MRTSALLAAVAALAFAAGFFAAPARQVATPRRAATSSTAIPSAVLPQPSASPVVEATPALNLPHAQIQSGLYHLNQFEAGEVGRAWSFVSAYNSGQLARVMAMLTDSPQLIDCDYSTRRMETIAGRAAITEYLRKQFAVHDQWTVDYYSENPSNTRLVVLLPITRRSDVLKKLGDASGVKRSFPVVFFLSFAADGTHIDLINWGTLVSDRILQREICTP